jgi:hypothetical protein
LIRHIQSVGSGNFFAGGRSNIFVSHKAETVAAAVSAAISQKSSELSHHWTAVVA